MRDVMWLENDNVILGTTREPKKTRRFYVLFTIHYDELTITLL